MATVTVGTTRTADEGQEGGATGATGLDAALDRAVTSADATAFLVVAGGEQSGRVYALRRNTVLVGRLEGADVFVADPSVSGRHARIIHGPRGFEIEDLESTNGTFVGGRRIQRSQLRSGDRVAVASLEFTFLLDRPIDATLAVLPASNRVLSRFGGLTGGDTYVHSEAPTVRDEDSAPSLLEIFEKLLVAGQFVHRYRRVIAAFLLTGVGLGAVSARALPAVPVAVSEVKLLPRVMTEVVERNNRDEDSFQFFAGAERAFGSEGLVEDSLTKLSGSLPDPDQVKAVSSRLALEPLGDHLFRASYKESWFHRGQPDPEAFLSAHLQGYVKSEVNKALKVFTAETAFLGAQMNGVQSDLSRITAEKASFKEANADQLPEDATQTQTSRFQLEGRRADLLGQIRHLQGELDAERKQVAADAPVAASRFQASQVYRDSLAKVNQRLSEAYAQGLANGHPEVATLLEEKRRIEDLVRNEMGSSTNDLDRQSNVGLQTLQHRVETLQGQLNAARADLADTEASLGRAKKAVGALPQVEATLHGLVRAEEETVHLHDQLFEKLKKAELQLNLERVSAESRFELVSPPHTEVLGPKKTLALRMTLGLLVGLFLATLFIAGRELPGALSRMALNLGAMRARRDGVRSAAP